MKYTRTMDPERLNLHGPRPVDEATVLRELRLAAEALGPWESAAEVGMPADASLRQIAYLFIGSIPAPINTAVDVVLGGFAAFLLGKGEAEAIDFR